MNNTVKGLLIFAAGAVAGSLGTYQYVKKKYERFAQEEIDSVKETFARREQELLSHCDEIRDEVTVEKLALNREKPDLTDYTAKLRSEGYIEDVDMEEEEEEETLDEDFVEPVQPLNPNAKDPYVIPPEEFGEIEEYDKITLTYYGGDGVLAYLDDQSVEDVALTIGEDSLNHFGEYEDDSVFVRNERYGIDYEILYDEGSYSEVLEKKPYLRED